MQASSDTPLGDTGRGRIGRNAVQERLTETSVEDTPCREAARNKPSQVTPWKVLVVIWGYAHHAKSAARWTPYTVRHPRDTSRESARRHTLDAGGDEQESTHETLPGKTQDATHETLFGNAVDDAGKRTGKGVREPRTRRWLEARQELRETSCPGKRDKQQNDVGNQGRAKTLCKV